MFYDGYFAILDEREIRWYGGDSHYSGFKASATGTTQIWTLPEDDGPDGYVLTTDGSGSLSWSEGNGGVSRFSDINFLSGTVQSDPAETWVSVGYYSIDPNEISDATRLELEAFILTSNAANAVLLRLYNVTSDKQIGETIESTSETIERVRQAIVFPDIVGTTADTYRIEYSNSTAGDAVTIGGAKIRLRTDTFSLAFGSLPEIWPGAVGVIFPVTVDADIPWAVSGPSGESMATGTGTGSSQNATVSVPLLKSDAIAIALSAGGSIADTTSASGGPMMLSNPQQFGGVSIPIGSTEYDVTVSAGPNRRVFVVANWSSPYNMGSYNLQQIYLNDVPLSLVGYADYKATTPYYHKQVWELLEASIPVAGTYKLRLTVGSYVLTTGIITFLEFSDINQGIVVDLQGASDSSSLPTGSTTTSEDNALAFSFCACASTSNEGEMIDGVMITNDGVSGSWQNFIGVRRVPTAGTVDLNWELNDSNYWSTTTFSLSGTALV